MKKLRLPKPVATNVVSRHRYLGSVYTGKQMRNFAEKAVLLELDAVWLSKTPPQRKPLTDEQWQVIADTLDCFITRSQKDIIEAKLKENT